MSAGAIEQTMADYFAAIRALDADACAATFAEDGVQEDPVGTPPNRGRDAIRQFFANLGATFDQLELTPDHTFINGTSAAVKWTARGAGKNGRAITFEGIDVMDFNSAGKIQHLRAFWDARAAMAQLQG